MPHAPDLSGSALDDRYELHAVIGEGAFGRVYQGCDRRLARPVAVKVIKPWWTDDPAWVAAFEREAQLLARVSDPGIVQIFDVGHAREGLYYVSELVDGENLAARLRRGPLSPWAASGIAAQLCGALAHAHSRGIVHRDVKPANVLLSSDGRVKVGDFGVARLAEGSTDGGSASLVGTPRYMAPEQGRGLATSPATDVYSVGAVLYEMLAGRPPFAGSTAVELALSHLEDEPPALPDGVPPALAEIVGRALAKDPAARFPDGAAMHEALVQARGRAGRTRPASLARGSAGARAPRRAAVGVAPAGAPRRVGARAVAVREPLSPAPVAHAGRPDRPGRADATRRAAPLSPRRNVNPSARRRAGAALGLVLVLLLAMAAGAVVLGGSGRTRVPVFSGLTRAQAVTRARAAHVRLAFTASYARRRAGTAIAQHPRAGVRAADGATVRVTLSRGPAPVAVPLLVSEDATDAESRLTALGLRVRVETVPAPGIAAGTVSDQQPAAGQSVAAGGAVVLSVAEVPQWRPLTSFDTRRSVVFRIRGDRWRVVYRMAYQGICTFIFFCSGPRARIADLSSGSAVADFGLSSGSGQIESLRSGPGLYQVDVTPGGDNAAWSFEVEDYY